MKEIIVLVIIVILSLVGYRRAYTDTRTPKYFSPIIFSEFLYIFLGLLMGPMFLNFLDSNILDSLTPLVLLGLGWIGILFGIQLKFSDIIRFPRSFFGVMIFNSVVPLIFVFIAFIFYFFYAGQITPTSQGVIVAFALVFAAMASCTSQSTMTVMGRGLIDSGKRNIVILLRYVSSLDDMVAIPLVGLAFAYEGFHTIGGEIYFRWWDVLLATVLLGLLSGFILNFIVRITEDKRELFLVVIGMVILSVGGARYLNVSPLLMSAISGMVLANMSPKQSEIMDILLLGEKPIFLIFLITIGALLEFSPQVLIVVPIYIGIRFLGKVLGGFGASLVFKTYFEIPRNIGLGSISQGSMAVAIALSFSQLAPDPIGGLIIFSVTTSILFNELLAPMAIKSVLGSAKDGNRGKAGTK